ncbi:hypothetical protein [Lutibaculum baratangense]|nr:hypothetical protein [Lutibaculum baratangense]
MKSEEAREKGRIARERLDDVLAKDGREISHAELAGAVRCIVAYRDGLIAARRAGRCTREELDRVNALLSLAHGAEYPLIGFHRHRIEQARDEIARMLADGAASGPTPPRGE